MSKVAITGNASGTGTFTIASPGTSTDRTLTLPDSAGTLATAESTLTQFNASGSAPVYAARAWVNFNGTGTVAIRASGNVSSITDNGTGDYTVNFTTAMPDTNFIVCGLPGQPSVHWGPAMDGGAVNTSSAKVTTQRRATATGTNEMFDYTTVNVAIFR